MVILPMLTASISTSLLGQYNMPTHKLGRGSSHKFRLHFPTFPTLILSTVIVKCCDELMWFEINMFD